MTKRRKAVRLIIWGVFLTFIISSWMIEFEPGLVIGANLLSFLELIVKIIPCAFILIGLFDVWVKNESVEKHLGQGAGPGGYFWMILLAGTTIGGLYVTFPIAYTLHQKGARMGIILTYISASAICRIPMTIFEASFLGLKFSLVRLLISIPLVLITSIWLGAFFEKSGFQPVDRGSDF